MNRLAKIIPLGAKETAKLSLSSIWRNKVRSALTMLGIVIGVSSVILLVSVGEGLELYITESFENLGSNIVIIVPGDINLEEGFRGPPNFSGSKLTLDHVREINTFRAPIVSAAASIELPATINFRGDSKFTTVAGISEEYSKIRNLEIAEGRGITDSDVTIGRRVAVLGKSVADELFGAINPIGQDITIGDEKFQVVGILESIGANNLRFDIDDYIAIPISTSQSIFGEETIQLITVQVMSKDDINEAQTILENYMNSQLDEDEFSVVDQSSLVSTINSILGTITAALVGISAISLVVGGVGIMNIMLVSVTERTKEIGLRKAVGAKPSDILNQFLIESVTLSVVGGAVGILIGMGGALALNQFFPTSISLWSISLAFGVSAAVGIIFGVAPAYRASKLDPIEALRYE